MLKAKLDQDIKQALLAGDKKKVEILRSLKSAILYAEVAQGAREAGLDEKSIVDVLSKESKKRQESADLYKKGGDENRAQAELYEKSVINEYLPKQLSDEELKELVETICAKQDDLSIQSMGKIISEVKEQSQGRADGGRIAQAVRARLQS